MYTKQEIILRRYREGTSQRQISKSLEISRKTVSKYIKEYEQLVQSGKSSQEALGECLSSKPRYNESGRHKIRLTQEVAALIDLMLSENQKKLLMGQAKQRLKKIDVLASLWEQGYDIGYTTVCNYITQKQKTLRVSTENKETFIRQEYPPGMSCEFDWGEVKLTIGGKLKRFQMAVFTSSYSNYRYAVLYERQDTLSFMESHVLFFSHIGGVYHEIVFREVEVVIGSERFTQGKGSEGFALSEALARKRTPNHSIGIMLRSYTNAINKQERRSGSLFRKQTKAECINCTEELSPSFIDTRSGTLLSTPYREYPQVCFDYIHNNPVKAKLADHQTDWEFSSAKDYAGLRHGTIIRNEIAKKFIYF